MWAGLLLNSGRDGSGVLERGSAAEMGRLLNIKRAGSGEEKLWSETFSGCELHKSEDTMMSIVERLVDEDAVKRETWDDIVEGKALEH